jgi:hypothetical protein
MTTQFAEFHRRAGTLWHVTTLLDEGDALVVRCDERRRLWPITRVRLEDANDRTRDTSSDLHWCPICTAERRIDAGCLH